MQSPFRMVILVVLTVVLLGVFSVPVGGQPTEPVDRKVIEDLIEKLASKNEAPKQVRDRIRVEYPKDYDQKAQDVVKAARKELVAIGKDSMPVLVEHLNDKRYSMTFATSVERNFTVGEVCAMILEEQVGDRMTYKMRMGADGQFHPFDGYFSRYYTAGRDTQAAFKAWWEENREKSLKEMQIDVLKWTIERERKVGFPTKAQEEAEFTPLIKQLNELTK
jgi:hypothetical protein